MSSYSDTQGYTAILAIVEAGQGVEQIWCGATPPHDFTSQSYPLVWVRPIGWEQVEDTDPPEPLRRCDFELRICAKGDGSLSTFARLDDLASELVEAIQHQGLGGAIPGLSLFTKGKHESSHQVEQLTVSGSFSYLRDEP